MPRAMFMTAALGLAGCATAPVPPPDPPPAGALPSKVPPADTGVTQAAFAEPAAVVPAAGERPPAELRLPDLIGLTLARNPRLAQVGWAVETARGRAVQAGLYPNPTLSVSGDELGDAQGPGGTWSAPHFSQEIVTADKLKLAQAAALMGIDQAALNVVAERYRLFTEVRRDYYEVVTLQRRAEILTQLIDLATKSVENADKLQKAKLGSELDVVQLEVDQERYRAELDATTRSLPAARRRLAASVGVAELPDAAVTGDLESSLPDYDLERVRAYVVGIHPDLRAAQVGVERAQLVLDRAAVEPIPNVTVGGGYVRQNQNRSSDWAISASIPLPLWNRNQGNIFAARADFGQAVNEVGRVQNLLVTQLATSFGQYAAARQRAERYRAAIIPKAEKTYELSQKAYQGGQFEYLRVLQAQRAVAEARLEYVRSLGEAWRAAAEVAGLMLEDQWPPVPPPAEPNLAAPLP